MEKFNLGVKNFPNFGKSNRLQGVDYGK